MQAKIHRSIRQRERKINGYGADNERNGRRRDQKSALESAFDQTK